jgi:multiple sugar transport system ATP-binding protein
VVVLRDGAIEQVGSPLDLYDRPANRFVAQFIGTPAMNLLPAAALPSLTNLAGLADGRLPRDGFMGVRPEGVRLRSAEGAVLAGRVELIEALGADTLIYVDVQGTSLVARQSERSTLHLGDAVGVELDTAALHLFAADGQVLHALAA